MATINFLAGKIVSLKDDGTVNAGGKVTFYVADGTFSTPITTYSNKALTTPNSSPIILDSAGRAKAYFSVNADVRILTSTDVLVYSERDVAPQNVKTVYTKATSFAIDASYADSVIEITAALTATVDSAATLGAGFSFTIINTAATTSTLARANAGDTINGSASNLVIQANSDISVTVNSGATGFLVDSIAGAAILSSANVFTNNQTISTASPRFILIETDAAANNQRWDIIANTESLAIRTVNDADSATAPIITVQRTGTVVDSVTIDGTTVSVTNAMTVGGIATLTGGRLAFPATQVSSADVNTLDDYEEGTWTPAIGGTATYLAQTGTYVKIGRTVFINCFITINVIGTGSTTIISGLPFSASESAACTVTQWTSIATASVHVQGQVANGTSTVVLGATAAAATTSGTGAVFGNSAAVLFFAMYRTAN